MYCRLIKVLFVLAIAACLVTPALAGNNWDGVGDWTTDVGNWQGDVLLGPNGSPNLPNTINLRSGTVNIDGVGGDEATGLILNQLLMGHPGGADGPGTAGDATLNMTGGILRIIYPGGTSGKFIGIADNSGALAVTLSGNAAMSIEQDAGQNGIPDFNMLGYGGSGTCCEETSSSTATVTLSDSATLTVNAPGKFRFGFSSAVQWGDELATNAFSVQLNDTSVLTVSSIDLGTGDGVTAQRDFQLNGGSFRMPGNVPDIPSALIPYVSGIGGVNQGGGLDVAYIRNYDSVNTSFTGLSEAIPEPTTLTLLGLGGFVAFMVSGRRRRQR